MNSPIETEVLEAASRGETQQLGALLEAYRGRLERMVGLRLDPKLQGRVDAADVLQETFIEVAQRLPRYLEAQDLPFFVWVRYLAAQKLMQLHRAHLGVGARAVGREVPLSPRLGPDASSLAAADVYLAHSETPSRVVAAGEERERVRSALDELGDLDREVLVLRHFEQLSNTEVAAVLELSPGAASARYVRALQRLEHAVSRGA
ncbi:MAG: sigma-70 family RNA polymerase sigma factor [Planctomycetota bacterium]